MVRKVAFISAGAAMGGVEFSTLYLLQRMDRTQWNSIVVCPTEGDLPDYCRKEGILVCILPRPRMLSTSIRLGKRRLPNPFAWAWDAGVVLASTRALAQLLQREHADLVVTKGLFPHLYGGLAARWAGVPCVWHLQDFLSERFWGLYRRGFGLLSRWLPTRVVADGGSIVRQLPPKVQARTTVIFNGVDTSSFCPGAEDRSEVRAELGIAASALVVGHAARITPWKGQHYLLEAFARFAHDLPEVHLLFVGSAVFDNNIYERRLHTRVAELGLQSRVTFAGYRHDLPRMLAAMDVFGYSSVEKDTSPLSLLSAMASGLPVVAFDIEGVREVVVNEENGLLVPVARSEELERALRTVLLNEDLRQRLARNARARSEAAFSVERHVSAMEVVMLEALRMAKERSQPYAP